nr:uncharacterized protein LOC104091210 [Nicotiana tomentosiformis]
MEFTREEMHTVPIWVKFSGLNFKYWSAKGLSKIGSLVGKPLMVDHNTEQKIGLSFARLLVEVNMDIALPEVVMFRNEMGNVVEQKVAYDWKLTVCKFCNKYGDSKEVCRKKNPSNPVQNAKEKQGEKEQATMEKMWEARPFLTRGMVNCLAWNVRGLNAPNKQREVKLLCNKFSVWRYTTNLNYHYNGRIVVVWRPDFYRVTPLSMNARVLSCEVYYIPIHATFGVSFVYAFNTKEEKKGMWEYLKEHVASCKSPWLVIGDFNSILNMEDRIRGNTVSWAKVMEFNKCIEACGLIELPNQGCKYSWNDKHSDQGIYSKIDWALINNDWLDSMPDCKAIFLPEGISDHCPVNERHRGRKPFKFCNVWTQHPQYLEQVERGWNIEIDGCKMLRAVRKLKLLKKTLRVLNKNFFKNIEDEVKEDREALLQVQKQLQLIPTDPNVQQEEHQKYQKSRHSSYLAEVYLQQKSKATWIKLGDDNIRYFYSVIKHKRLQQAITQLKDDRDNW